LLKIDLASTNFTGVAETLRTMEVVFQTNLTTMVDSTHNYTAFRSSFAFKKWRHDSHGDDARNLAQTQAKNRK
jgi:hypothetical protein